MNVNSYPKNIFVKFLYVTLFLLAADILGIVSRVYFDHNYVHGLVPLFDFNREGNVPTFYSSLLLFTAGGLLFFIASRYKMMDASFLPWLGLSLVFVFLSIDETARIHEGAGVLFKSRFELTGILFYGWVVPYGLALIAFVLVYLKFLFKLPRKMMVLFIASGAIYVTGALGIELLGGRHAEVYGREDVVYAALYTCEEFLEMLGINLFIYTLLRYISSVFRPFVITLHDE